MLLHAIMAASRANGPGLRAVVWFQGCALNCRNCFNAAHTRLRGTTFRHPKSPRRSSKRPRRSRLKESLSLAASPCSRPPTSSS